MLYDLMYFLQKSGLTNCLQPKYSLGLNKLEFLEPLHFSENKAPAEGIFLYLAD
jgi:hypothetical protein